MLLLIHGERERKRESIGKKKSLSEREKERKSERKRV